MGKEGEYTSFGMDEDGEGVRGERERRKGDERFGYVQRGEEVPVQQRTVR